jgi:hypothetical protein
VTFIDAERIESLMSLHDVGQHLCLLFARVFKEAFSVRDECVISKTPHLSHFVRLSTCCAECQGVLLTIQICHEMEKAND